MIGHIFAEKKVFKFSYSPAGIHFYIMQSVTSVTNGHINNGLSEKSFSGTYSHAAVAADAAICSTVGSNILKNGGSAVDATIASLLCVGVVNLHSTGIGGGGFMVYYNATSKEAYAIDFRETAPMNASTYMFNDTAQNASEYGKVIPVLHPTSF